MSVKKSSRRKAIAITAVIALFAFAASFIWIFHSNGYKADAAAIDEYCAGMTSAVTEIDKGVAYGNGNEEYGFIFYPGGNVEYTAYAPLLRSLAENGVFCVTIKMPFDLAVFGENAADGISESYPEIERWYIGGHSLGGVIAAEYAAKHPQGFEGLIMLASYTTADLSGSGLAVLSIYGSEDGVLNRRKYSESLDNLPSGYVERVIDGGCHAYFGMYGAQTGDGQPGITAAEQTGEAARIILDFIN